MPLYNGKYKKLSIVVRESSPVIENMIKSLAGLLIGDQDRTREQAYQITSDILPLDLQQSLGHVFDAIYYCKENQIPPTRENLLSLFEINKRLQNPAVLIDEILSRRTDDGRGVREFSAFISTWLQEERGIAGVNQISDLMKDPTMDYQEKYDQALGLMSAISPTSGQSEIKSLGDAFDDFVEDQKFAVSQRKAGLDIGPHLPFTAAKAAFARFDWGKTTAIVAQTGYGKTFLLLQIGKHIVSQKIKTDFYHVSFETDINTLMSRLFAQFSLIPSMRMASGEVDLENPKYSGIVAAYRKHINKVSEESGHHHFIFMPAPLVSSICNMMDRCVSLSERLGRRAALGLDHIHNIAEWEYAGNETERTKMAIDRLTSQNTALGSHLFLLGQEGTETGQMYGSKFGSKRSQMVISIQRTGPEGGVPTTLPLELTYEDKRKVHLKDSVGDLRNWQTVGDQYLSKAKLVMTKFNDGVTSSIDLNIENRFGTMYQDPNQIIALKKAGRLENNDKLYPTNPKIRTVEDVSRS